MLLEFTYNEYKEFSNELKNKLSGIYEEDVNSHEKEYPPNPFRMDSFKMYDNREIKENIFHYVNLMDMEYSDRFTKNKDIEQGYFLKCECGYKGEARLVVDINDDGIISPSGVRCIECGTFHKMEDMLCLTHNTCSNEKICYLNFNEKNDNVTVNTTKIKFSCYGENVVYTRHNIKFCFNTKLGTQYILPVLNVNTGKLLTKTKFRRFTFKRYYNDYLPFLTYEQFIELGELLEKRIGAKVIPFKDYIKDIHLAEEDTLSYFRVLSCYNANPFVDIHYSLLYYSININNYVGLLRRKLRNIRVTRNPNLDKEMQKYMKQYFFNKPNIMKYVYNLLSDIGFIDANFGYDCLSPFLVLINIIHKDIKTYKGKLAIFNALESELKGYNKFNTQKLLFLRKYINSQLTNSIKCEIYSSLNEEEAEFILYKSLSKHLFTDFGIVTDTFYMYNRIIKLLPEYRLPINRLRWKELHDKLSLDFMRINNALRYYTYPSGVYDLECSIDNYKVHLVRNTSELKLLGNTMRNCVATYDKKIEQGTTLILYMSNIKTNEKVACIELNVEKNEIVQVEGYHHSKLDKDVAEAFQKWCKKFNLNNYIYTGRETDMFIDYKIDIEIDSYNKEVS